MMYVMEKKQKSRKDRQEKLDNDKHKEEKW